MSTMLTTYVVTLSTPKGEAVLEVPAMTENAARRRAFWAAVHARWGDVNEVSVTNVEVE